MAKVGSTLLAGARESLARNQARSIQELVEETLGENPCRQLLLQKKGDPTSRFGAICDRKRCTDCGPRKQLTIQLQIQHGFGATAYVMRSEPQQMPCHLTECAHGDRYHTHLRADIAPIRRAIDRAKQRKRTHGEDYTYQIVGDQSQGYIMVSDVLMDEEEQKLRELAGYWMQQILSLYHRAAERIRRSQRLGVLKVSPLRLFSRRLSGETSEYEAVTGDMRREEQAGIVGLSHLVKLVGIARGPDLLKSVALS